MKCSLRLSRPPQPAERQEGRLPGRRGGRARSQAAPHSLCALAAGDWRSAGEVPGRGWRTTLAACLGPIRAPRDDDGPGGCGTGPVSCFSGLTLACRRRALSGHQLMHERAAAACVPGCRCSAAAPHLCSAGVAPAASAELLLLLLPRRGAAPARRLRRPAPSSPIATPDPIRACASLASPARSVAVLLAREQRSAPQHQTPDLRRPVWPVCGPADGVHKARALRPRCIGSLDISSLHRPALACPHLEPRQTALCPRLPALAAAA